MKLLPLMLLFCFQSFGQDTIKAPKIHYISQLKHSRFDSIAEQNRRIDFYPPEARYEGGHEALVAFIYSNIRYPEAAIEKGIEGKVYVRFTVNEDGSISDIEVVRPAHPLLVEEAVRLISIMPNWIPGIYKGQNVPVKVSLPITFTMNRDEGLGQSRE